MMNKIEDYKYKGVIKDLIGCIEDNLEINKKSLMCYNQSIKGFSVVLIFTILYLI